MNVVVKDASNAVAQSTVTLVVDAAGQYINATLKKFKVTIPWKQRDRGTLASDSCQITMRFPAPETFVLDAHARGEVCLGDYTINLMEPYAAAWRSSASFRFPSKGMPSGSASVKWATSSGEIVVNIALQKARLAEELARYGMNRQSPSTFLLPLRLVVNEFDTGTRQISVSYRLTAAGKGIVSLPSGATGAVGRQASLP